MSRTRRTDGDGRSYRTDEYLFDLMCYTACEKSHEACLASASAALSNQGDVQESGVSDQGDVAEGGSLGFSLPLTRSQKHGFYAKLAIHWACINNETSRSRQVGFSPSHGELDEAAHRFLADFLEDDAGGVAAQKKDESNISESGSDCKPAFLVTVLQLVNEFPLWVKEFASSGVGSMSIEDIQGLTRQSPWLLPRNRKIRHLKGISLRNVTFDDPFSSSRTETIDDDALSTTYVTPQKLTALREDAGRLEHSRSSGDLKTISGKAGDSVTPGVNMVRTDGSAASRPSAATIRRRSTYNWGSTTPDIRQKKLEDVIVEKLPDIFVAIYPVGSNNAIYISETIKKSMNPDFGFVDMSTQEPWLTRLDEVVINVFAKTDNMSCYGHLVQTNVRLSSLQWLGKSLTEFRNPLPPNCIIWHFTDGIYALFTHHLPITKQIFPTSSAVPLSRPFTPSTPGTPRTEGTSSFDSLMRLKNLDDCIQDSDSTRQGIIDKINRLLHDSSPSRSPVAALTARQEILGSTETSKSIVQRELDAKQRKKADIHAENIKRLTLMAKGRAAQDEALKCDPEDSLPEAKEDLQLIQNDLRGQVRRIAEELSSLFPVEPIDGKPLNFTIRGVYLPNADELSPAAMQRSSTTESEVAYSLDLVCYVVEELAFALEYRLPYPVVQFSSHTLICDDITRKPFNGKRQFPLYQTGTTFAEFEYGVYLLNSDISGLMQTQKIKMVNPKTTLANLKYLLAVLGSGQGEIPQRKAGRNKALDTGVQALAANVQHVNIGGEIIASDPASMDMGVPESGAVINGRANDKGKQRAAQDMPVVKSIGPYTHYIKYSTTAAATSETNGKVSQTFN
ncbi:hypothetical protein MMC17_007529 [Xylographa soralifera]|nr:hypothetical protein [Xylographa soralifera]